MKEKFYDKLNTLSKLYQNVRLAMFLLEQLDEKCEMYIAPINELRNALDHVFRAIKLDEDVDYELGLVKEHIERAGYDALTLLAAKLGTRIAKNLEPYETDTFTNVFPEYFTRIKPKITEIQSDIAEYRNGRGKDSEENFITYFDKIKELIDIDKEVDRRIPALQDFSDKKKREEQEQQRAKKIRKRNDRVWKYIIGPIIGFVSAIIIAYLIWLLNK